MIQSRVMIPHGHTCVVCGRPIRDVEHYAFRGTCDAWKCRAVLFRQFREERRLGDQEESLRRRLIERLRDEALAAQGRGTPADCAALAIPANDRPLVALSATRRQGFAEHLRGVIEAAFGHSEGAAGDGDPEPPQASSAQAPYEAEPAAVLAETCATCAGHCCLHGGERAYVTAETIRGYRSRHPGATAEAIRDAYLGQLGDTTYEHSCVCHGAGGCALPREMRSEACNSFFCEALTRVQQACTRGAIRLFLAAWEDGRVLRGRLVAVPVTGQRPPEP